MARRCGCANSAEHESLKRPERAELPRGLRPLVLVTPIEGVNETPPIALTAGVHTLGLGVAHVSVEHLRARGLVLQSLRGGRCRVVDEAGRSPAHGIQGGWQAFYNRRTEGLVLEGHPSGRSDSLGSSVQVRQATEAVVTALLARHGIAADGDPVCRRLDIAVTMRFASCADGVAFIRAMAETRFPRQKVEVIGQPGQPPETVYGLSLTGKRLRRLWRCYDSGQLYGGLPRGLELRLEHQWEPALAVAPRASTVDALLLYGEFWRRFRPLVTAPSVAAMPSDEMFATLIDRESVKLRRLEMAYFFLAAEAAGLAEKRFTKDQRKERRRLVRELGLVTSPRTAVEVDFRATLAPALDHRSWA